MLSEPSWAPEGLTTVLSFGLPAFTMEKMRLYQAILPFLCIPAFLAPAFSQAVANSSTINFQAASGMGQDLYQMSATTGMVLVIVHNDKVFIEGYGEDAPHSHQVPTKESFVMVCSIT